MATETTTQLKVYVFIGEPDDFKKLRHAALWFETGDDLTSFLIHVTKLQATESTPTAYRAFYHVDVNRSFNPLRSLKIVGSVNLGPLEKQITSTQLADFLSETPVDNSDPEFNCQVWVQGALQRLKDKGYLSEEQYEKGFDGMIKFVSEATDEPNR
ncbi:hypothetical protein IWX90DRAFT_54268 [Phyllosticta citrichinensis]|uniref:Uncharacterized protein n=1 Tax=Phyllosticta citrichinensis TaxID=1130410 RepID=A0ABR1XIJ4_9PEZI